MRNRGVRGEQWAFCDRCGRQYPMSHLGYQNGLVVCYIRCWDDRVDPEHREKIINDILNQGITEGADLRFSDPSFFANDTDRQ